MSLTAIFFDGSLFGTALFVAIATALILGAVHFIIDKVMK